MHRIACTKRLHQMTSLATRRSVCSSRHMRGCVYLSSASAARSKKSAQSATCSSGYKTGCQACSTNHRLQYQKDCQVASFCILSMKGANKRLKAVADVYCPCAVTDTDIEIVWRPRTEDMHIHVEVLSKYEDKFIIRAKNQDVRAQPDATGGRGALPCLHSHGRAHNQSAQRVLVTILEPVCVGNGWL